MEIDVDNIDVDIDFPREGYGWAKGGKEVEGNGVLRHLKIEGRNNELFLIKSLVHFIDLHILPGL